MYVATFLCLAVTFSGISANRNKELNGTTAVVTGAAKGIGYAIAENFLKSGAERVIIVDKNKPRGVQAESKLNKKYGVNRAVFIYGDITKDLDKVSNKIFCTYGCVDILVNNAGIMNEYNPRKTILTNALGTTLWTGRFFEVMRKDKGGKGGTIINVASSLGYSRDPFLWFYKSSKYAILGLTFGLGHEYNFLTSGVRIYAICPGYTYTDLTKQQGVVDEQVVIYQKLIENTPKQTPDQLGRAAADLYKTAKTGTAYSIIGGEAPVESPAKEEITVDFLLSVK